MFRRIVTEREKMSVLSGNILVTVGNTDFERILFKISKSSRNFKKCQLEAITH